ncbi:amidohydrolase [Acidaminococcus sp. NSJ-142]|jgi:aminobenzoyl-glutamate utilization protein B|uniref:amidohydrolase n=1 Tax=Acidaminococcus TaxID=904 RepID=UPI000CF8F575|nr:MULTISPECIES: amidohydrolase [Acidaminococcus]MCD2434422.1 amidohydrolase [Acidaminococcus hominis]MCH4096814.1 amidohydrolase [Acidaminococcus provencensis]RHK03710.1 amidohydrolase [Acidaminococcus sp. AM05-11]
MELTASYEKMLEKLNAEIWDFAELKFNEVKSAAAMTELLEKEGFRVTRGLAHMPTAYMAEYGSGKPVIAILAEYDALSGLSQQAGVTTECAREGTNNGHGCGHCLLGTAAVGAGLLLRDYLKDKPGKGTVRVYGCPAEEGGSGKTYMAREGVFDDVDAALTWHPGTQNEIMTGSNQANIQAAFTFKGRAAHAAGAPQNGRSALDAVELMDVGVNYMREHMADYDRVHYAILDTGGVSPNVVQAHAQVLYLIRSKTNEETKRLYDRVVNIAKGAALMTETELSVRFDKAVSNLVPNTVLGKVLYDALVAVGAPKRTEEEKAYLRSFQAPLGQERVLKDPGMAPYPDAEHREALIAEDPYGEFIIPYVPTSATQMGSSDTGDVSYVTPLAQFITACFAIGTSAHSWQWVAQDKGSVALKGCFYAAKVLAQGAETLFTQPQVLADAQAELKKRMKGKKYVCPIPGDVWPRGYQVK